MSQWSDIWILQIQRFKCFILEDLCEMQSQNLNLYFCRAQFLVVRALSSLINTSVHSVIGAMPACTTFERMKPFTEGATLTCVRFAVKLFNLLQAFVVTWRSIRESLSSSVTFAAASFVMNVIARNI